MPSCCYRIGDDLRFSAHHETDTDRHMRDTRPIRPQLGSAGRSVLDKVTGARCPTELPDTDSSPEAQNIRGQRLPQHAGRAADARGRGDRPSSYLRRAGSAVRRKADRAAANLRRPGRDRDRECPAVRRGAGQDRAISPRPCTYQTGSANILKVIASSPTDVEPVLKAIVESACELCDAYDAVVLLKDGETLALQRAPRPDIRRARRDRPSTGIGSPGASVIDQSPVQVRDFSAEAAEFPEAPGQSRNRVTAAS